MLNDSLLYTTESKLPLPTRWVDMYSSIDSLKNWEQKTWVRQQDCKLPDQKPYTLDSLKKQAIA